MATVRVAAIQATPVILDGEASVAKAVDLIAEAAREGAQLAVLPETFVPLYPSNAWAAPAARFGVHCVIGVNERDRGSLFNTMLVLGPGGLLHRHRKLMPTHHERLFHGIGAGDDLDPVETPLGRIGGLICWENRMPLARWRVYQGAP